jgi:mannose-6-phosphate isomerase
MSEQPIFLEPVFKDRIWGGTRLRDIFGYSIPTETTGEAWAVSAHPNGQSIVRSGKFKGKTLGELWTHYPELFAAKSKTFPLLVKILDASQDLSVQVHPNDDYANEHENGELGKTESWYIMESTPGAEIVFGHSAQTKEQFVDMIGSGDWGNLLSKVQVKKGDFFFVPSGTLHALGKGIVVLEIQQSSDTTYRVYDYDRIDADGKQRDLHLEKAIDVTTIPHIPPESQVLKIQKNGAIVTTLVSNSFFTIKHIAVDRDARFDSDDRFVIYSVIEGNGELLFESIASPLNKGDFFILPANFGPYQLFGKMELILSKC